MEEGQQDEGVAQGLRVERSGPNQEAGFDHCGLGTEAGVRSSVCEDSPTALPPQELLALGTLCTVCKVGTAGHRPHGEDLYGADRLCWAKPD